jgi:hypothetical protein
MVMGLLILGYGRRTSHIHDQNTCVKTATQRDAFENDGTFDGTYQNSTQTT